MSQAITHTASPAPSLDCQQLTVSISEVRVVDRLHQSFAPGEFWGILGANGVGKTTLLRHLAGLNLPDSGDVLLKGRSIHHWPRRKLARSLGMLQQHSTYVFDASVLEVALTGRHPWLGPWGREGAEDLALAREAIKSVDLGALESRSVTQLSGGEVRRLAFAALLVQSPEVMLLDEPTNHLDFRHQVRIMRTIGNRVYRDGKMALAALHDVNLAATYCSHVLLIFGEGEWLAGTATELLHQDNLERLYQCPVTEVDTQEGRRFHPSFSDMGDGS